MNHRIIVHQKDTYLPHLIQLMLLISKIDGVYFFKTSGSRPRQIVDNPVSSANDEDMDREEPSTSSNSVSQLLVQMGDNLAAMCAQVTRMNEAMMQMSQKVDKMGDAIYEIRENLTRTEKNMMAFYDHVGFKQPFPPPQ